MHRSATGALSALVVIGLSVTSACRRGSEGPRWEAAGIETRQNPLLLPIDGMLDVTKLCTPAPCANGEPLRAAINNALHVQGKRALFFPAGEHVVNHPIFLPSNTTVGGLGASSIVRRTGSGDGAVFYLDGVSHVTIANLHFYTHKAGETSYTRPAIELASSTGTASTNIRIVNNMFVADPTHPTAFYAGAVGASGTVKLSETWITNNYTRNMLLFHSSGDQVRNVFISDNKIDGAPINGISVYRSQGPVRYENIIITNNNLSRINSGSGIFIGAGDSANVSGVMQNIKVANNSISTSGSTVTFGMKFLNLVHSASEPRPTRNIAITGNTITRVKDSTTALYGIVIGRSVGESWAENVTISGNSVHDEDGRSILTGIEANFLRNSIIADNTLGNPGVGIRVLQHEGLLIKGNHLTAPSTDPMAGIWLGYGNDALVTGNVVTGRTSQLGAFALHSYIVTTPKTTWANIVVRGNRFVGLGAPTTCALYLENTAADVRYYNNDLTKNVVFCPYAGGKAFVDNMVDTPTNEGQLARHFTKLSDPPLNFDLSSTSQNWDDKAIGGLGGVPGVREGDSVALGLVTAPPSGVTLHGFVSSPNTVTVRAVRQGPPISGNVPVTVRATVLQYAN